MSAGKGRAGPGIPPQLARVVGRHVLVFSPTIRFRLEPGDRALVAPGDAVVPGMPIVERTLEPELVRVGRIAGSDGGRQARRDEREERRGQPAPGKWWVGGGERRRKLVGPKVGPTRAGTLLYETNGSWQAAAGERQETVESPVGGIVREARNAVAVAIEVTGAALPGAIAAGEPSRGYLDVPRLTDGDLWASALDVGRAGAVVVAGSRLSAQSISRARAMSIRGLIAGSVGEGELRDLEASRQRQKASLTPFVSFGLIALDGHGRRPLATPILALLAAMAGREVAIVTDPPLLVFDAAEVPLPELPPDWIRARSGPHAGREGRWLRSAGSYRFRGGIHLEAAVVRFADEAAATVVPVTDLERFVF